MFAHLCFLCMIILREPLPISEWPYCGLKKKNDFGWFQWNYFKAITLFCLTKRERRRNSSVLTTCPCGTWVYVLQQIWDEDCESVIRLWNIIFLWCTCHVVGILGFQGIFPGAILAFFLSGNFEPSPIFSHLIHTYTLLLCVKSYSKFFKYFII